MKKHIIILSTMVFSFSTLAIDISVLKDLDVSDRVKRQMLDGIELKQSIEHYKMQRGADFVTVGTTNDCDYRLGTTKIQDAIDANEIEIRVASNDDYNENLSINDKSITIKGGYVDCAAAVNDIQSGRTTITGVMVGFPVVLIFGDTQRNTIVLDSLALTGGSGTGLFPGGGISSTGADAQISLNNVHIASNNSIWGGGIAIIGGNTDLFATKTLVFSNTAEIGGGIYCSGEEASITMLDASGVSLSGATGVSGSANDGQGGGIFVNECDFSIYSGTAGGLLDFRGISANFSTRQGGGIYAQGGSTVTLYGSRICVLFFCFGDNTNPVNLNTNRSNSDNTGSESGGGAYITGADTLLNIYTGYVKGNSAIGTAAGGGVALAGGAQLVVNRLQKECWNPTKCSYFTGNTANFGGAIDNNASTVEITHTVFEGNRASFGTAIYGINANSTTIAKGSLFYNNGDNAVGDFGDGQVFRVRESAEIDIHHSTIADNNTVTSVFGIHATSGGTSELFSSIVHESGLTPVNVYAGSPGTINVDCVIAHEVMSIPSAVLTIQDDPEFVDRVNGDYHINAAISPAVDYCDDATTSVDYLDMDFENRGWNDPAVANNQGAFDIGVDETYGNDIIFKDGFE